MADEVEREKLKRKLAKTVQQAKAKVEEVHNAYVVGTLQPLPPPCGRL